MSVYYLSEPIHKQVQIYMYKQSELDLNMKKPDAWTELNCTDELD